MKLNDIGLKELQEINKDFTLYSRICKFAVFICFILISLFSLLPADNLPPTDVFLFADKGAHALAYLGFSFFLFLSFTFSIISKNVLKHELDEKRENKIALFYVFIIGLPFGIIIEFIQSKVGRYFDLYDWLADSVGILIGCIIAMIVNHLVINHKMKN